MLVPTTKDRALGYRFQQKQKTRIRFRKFICLSLTLSKSFQDCKWASGWSLNATKEKNLQKKRRSRKQAKLGVVGVFSHGPAHGCRRIRDIMSVSPRYRWLGCLCLPFVFTISSWLTNQIVTLNFYLDLIALISF